MRILMVDDENLSVQSYVDALEDDGHTVTKVETAERAREEFDKSPWPYDLLILDVQLRPKGDETTTDAAALIMGITLYREFRATHPRPKVVILTNNYREIPPDVVRDDSNTKAFDKALTDCIELADFLKTPWRY